MYLTYYVHLVGTKEVIGCNSLNSHDVFKNFTELNTQDLEHIVKKLNSGRKMAWTEPSRWNYEQWNDVWRWIKTDSWSRLNTLRRWSLIEANNESLLQWWIPLFTLSSEMSLFNNFTLFLFERSQNFRGHSIEFQRFKWTAHCTEQRPYWEANRFSAGQEILRIFWNPKVHYFLLNHLSTIPLLSLINLVWTHPISWRSILILFFHLCLCI